MSSSEGAIQVAEARAVAGHDVKLTGDLPWLTEIENVDIDSEYDTILNAVQSTPGLRSENNLIEIVINASTDFISLDRSFINVRAHTVSALAANGATSVKLVETSADSLWERIVLLANDVVVGSAENYTIGSFLASLVQYSSDSTSSAEGMYLASSNYMPAAAGTFIPEITVDDSTYDCAGPADTRTYSNPYAVGGITTINQSLSLISPNTYTRHQMANISNGLTTSSPFNISFQPNLGMWQQPRLIPPGTNLRLQLYRASDAFCVNSNNSPAGLNAQIYIEQISASVHYLRPTESARQAYLDRWRSLESVVGLKGAVYYNVDRFRMFFGSSIAPALTGTNINMNSFYTGKKPLWALVTFVNTSALSAGTFASTQSALSFRSFFNYDAGVSAPRIMWSATANTVNMNINGIPVRSRAFGDPASDPTCYREYLALCKASSSRSVLLNESHGLMKPNYAIGYPFWVFRFGDAVGSADMQQESIDVSLDFFATITTHAIPPNAIDFSGLTPVVYLQMAEGVAADASGMWSSTF